jgi:predicted nucleic acid-binding protein
VTYVDTSVLVALYAFEDGAEGARRLLSGLSHAVALNAFLSLELRNALRRKVPTGKASKPQSDEMFRGLERSLREGALKYQAVDFHRVFYRAEDLSERFTRKLNARAFDVLHVAIALETGCRSFLTFDKDQAKLAKAAGLSMIV